MKLKDRRRLNQVSWMENRNGEFFVFGNIGSGKNRTVVTLAYRKTKTGILKAYAKYKKYLGKLRTEIPRDR